MLGIELITTTYGRVYNGIADDETCRQPESETHRLHEVLGTVGWSCRRTRASGRFLVHASLFV